MEKKAWWKESVVYQIYPRSFNDSNGDGIGDLKGIIEKLDYVKDLGVDVIWLCPIYQSPNDDNGYDISDYQGIMKEFGTMKDFDTLLEEAHHRGLKILMDLVVNHTSDEHAWFIESRKGEDPFYRDFYIWSKEKPNNWESYFGGFAWEYDETRKEYYLHLFSKKQPDLNWKNPNVREKVYEMMTWWLEKGIDGFRMDVINLISKMDGFPEGEPIPHTPYTEKNPYVVCGPHLHEYLKEMNQKVLSKYDIMTVGEALNITLEEGKKITDEREHELQMIFHFEHMNVEYPGKEKWTDKRFKLVDLKKILAKWQDGLKDHGWNSLYWNNHDQPRVVSRFGDDGEYWEPSAKMLATCLHLMKGTPYIYQGEEIGMTNVKFPSISDYRDIEILAAYDKYTKMLGYTHEQMMKCIYSFGRDNGRTPMQWNDSKNAGFTQGTPWIGVNPNYTKINVEKQLRDKNSILHYYKKLIKLRKSHEIIVYGDFKMLYEEDPNLFVYERILEGEKILVVLNFTKEEQTFNPPEEWLGKEAEVLISNYENEGKITEKTLKPYEAVAYLLKN